ncbi:glycosyltransferase [Phosphitispora fastidiosa]|uniref:glycosyltransferase n=1 Tax=Phosphitispora fastidiosa TaxID=2837202 RepID=UPI001E2C5E1D|nr:hypothetical protein [Phosphitispora fastidiosa]
MGKKQIIVNINFNTHRFTDKRLTKEWIDERIGVFNKFTLRSLKNQTNQDFLTLVNYDPVTESLVMDALGNHEKLPDNVKFVTPSEKNVINNIKGYDHVYIVRIDSDNLYHTSFIQQLHDYNPKEETQVLINQKGYVYDSVNNKLATYFQVSPSFYTLVYKVEDYLKGIRHVIPGTHGAAIKLPHEILDRSNYTIVIHTCNFMNGAHLFKWKDSRVITDKDEYDAILKDFMGSSI